MRRAVIVALGAAVAVSALVAARDVRRRYWSTRGATVIHFTLPSARTHPDLHEILVVPRGGGPDRELVVFLHGRSSSPASNLDQRLFDTLRSLGRRAPVVLLADGGDHSYWHDRRDGAWATALLREAIPAALEQSHANPRRVAIGGISMGGFGALDVARLAPHRFCAVGAHSAALWATGGETAAGAFDDAADFARHDLIALARTRRLYDIPVWIDVGRDDPFYSADVTLAQELRAHGTDVRLVVHGGGHSGWSSRFGEYFRFYAAAC